MLDADGYWPPVAIREAIESTRSRELESGIITGVYNNRGVTTRAPTDGEAPHVDQRAGGASGLRRCSSRPVVTNPGSGTRSPS
jgi:hypothetical protein